MTRSVCLLQDNARTNRLRVELLEDFSWDVLYHSTHSPDLTPSDNYLFTELKEFLAVQRH